VVAGKTSEGIRVVGVQQVGLEEGGVVLSDQVRLFPQSVAKIPSHVTDKEAMATLQVSLAGVHCVLPRMKIGGSQDEGFVSGKVVIMGGSDYACFCARGLVALGAKVHMVSTGTPKVPSTVDCMPPGTDDLGFAQVLATFDVLLDTLSDEARLGESSIGDDNIMIRSGSGVVQLLSKRHLCHRYVSTMTASQRIVRDNGVFFGPKKAQEQLEMMVQKATPIVPPLDFGTTVERLLEKNIIFDLKYKGNEAVRTWNLPDFWELASWPRDSSGGANVRFGLPVIDDLGLDLLQEAMDKQEQVEFREAQKPEEINPFVTPIVGVEGMQQIIVDAGQTCLLFLSAPFCRTCKSLAPAYTRMARLQGNDSLIFAKADTSGKTGKALGKALEIDAVPAFVLFRNGQRFGTPLSVTRIPSQKLNLAVEMLTSGKEWDSAVFQGLEEEEEKPKN